jgi:hypothetical protein
MGVMADNTSALREAARRIHWEACGKPKAEQDGYYAALAIVNDELHKRGEKGFGE